MKHQKTHQSNTQPTLSRQTSPIPSSALFGQTNQTNHALTTGNALTQFLPIQMPYLPSHQQPPVFFTVNVHAGQEVNSQQNTSSIQDTQAHLETETNQDQIQQQEQSAIQETLQTVHTDLQTLVSMQNSTQQQLEALQKQYTHTEQRQDVTATASVDIKIEDYLSRHSGKLLLGCLCTQWAGFYILNKRIAKIGESMERATTKLRKTYSFSQQLGIIKKRILRQKRRYSAQARDYINKLATVMHEVLVS